MEYKTKEYYRNTIKEIAQKTKMSEIYIARKTIELCNNAERESKQSHIGYYLIDDGRSELYNKLQYKEKILKTINLNPNENKEVVEEVENELPKGFNFYL